MQYSFRSLARPLAGLSIALAVPSAVSAQTVMTFTPIACETGGSRQPTPPSTYSEGGFTLFTAGPAGFATWCEDSPNYAGPGLFINTPEGNADLTKDGGGPFSIHAIELAHVYAGTYPEQSFTFMGFLVGGGTVSQTFTIGDQEGSPAFFRFEFSDAWTNLLSVGFAPQEANYYQFTNILLDLDATAIPEPASIALLGTGLIGVFGVGAIRRRRSGSA